MSETKLVEPKPAVLTIRLSRLLHKEFKKTCVEHGNVEMTEVVRVMVRLFVEDKEFRERILREIKRVKAGGDGV